MKIAIIGRSENLYHSAEYLVDQGHEVKLVITSKEAPEYTKTSKDFENFAARQGAEFFYCPKIKTIYDDIKSMDLDIGISMNYVDVIDQETIDIFKHGISTIKSNSGIKKVFPNKTQILSWHQNIASK